jgi:hypothetical protein
MHIFIKVGLAAFVLGASLGASGCSAAGDDERTTPSVDTTATAREELSSRCTVRGNPPVTTGCTGGQTCSVIACTNSVPPTCFGTCKPPPPVPNGCEGAFNCLCGTPTCVDGEWTCVGDCRPTPKSTGCEGAFNCLCGTAACVDGEWTCIGDCKSPTPPQ